jgi:hypothetical protein
MHMLKGILGRSRSLRLKESSHTWLRSWKKASHNAKRIMEAIIAGCVSNFSHIDSTSAVSSLLFMSLSSHELGSNAWARR